MAKEIKELTLKSMGQMAGKEHGEYLDNQFLMVMSAIQFGKNFMRDGQPYRVEDGRVIRVISGHAKIFINSIPGQRLKKEDMQIMADKAKAFAGRLVVEFTVCL